MLLTNKIICGEARKELRKVPDNSINLVYLDPPFFTNRRHETISRSCRVYHFDDKWHEGLHSYVEFMSEVFGECHRVLTKSGSLYLHCDSHASHYLKIELDKLFGYNNFRNEIIWKRHNAHNNTKQGTRLFGRVHDVILFYTKSRQYTWNPIFQPYSEKYVKKYYKFEDCNNGKKYALGDLSGPGGRVNGNPRFEFLGVCRYWRYNKETMQRLHNEGKIIQKHEGSVPKLKRYLDEMPGIVLQDVWDNIPSVKFAKNEDIDYPTQKPIRLLERVIEISTNPSEIVLDPFCGSGTTLIAARNLSRRFIGIDKNVTACRLSRNRLRRKRLVINRKMWTYRYVYV